MRISTTDDDTFEIPLTPLIDVVFLLLIFFLVATNFTRREVDQQIKLPTAAVGEKNQQSSAALIINLRGNGVITVNRREIASAELPKIVREWKEKNPQQRAVVRGDKEITYAQIIEILAVCRANGIEQVDLPTASLNSIKN